MIGRALSHNHRLELDILVPEEMRSPSIEHDVLQPLREIRLTLIGEDYFHVMKATILDDLDDAAV